MGKTIVIDEDLHDRMKKYCKENKIKINDFISGLIDDHLNFMLEKKSLLPMILKNSRGEIVETIICNDLSSEYKKNLPKELTLMRSTFSGDGFIANYIQK